MPSDRDRGGPEPSATFVQRALNAFALLHPLAIFAFGSGFGVVTSVVTWFGMFFNAAPPPLTIGVPEIAKERFGPLFAFCTNLYVFDRQLRFGNQSDIIKGVIKINRLPTLDVLQLPKSVGLATQIAVSGNGGALALENDAYREFHSTVFEMVRGYEDSRPKARISAESRQKKWPADDDLPISDNYMDAFSNAQEGSRRSFLMRLASFVEPCVYAYAKSEVVVDAFSAEYRSWAFLPEEVYKSRRIALAKVYVEWILASSEAPIYFRLRDAALPFDAAILRVASNNRIAWSHLKLTGSELVELEQNVGLPK